MTSVGKDGRVFGLHVVQCMCACFPWRSEKAVECPRTEVLGGCELPCGC